MYSQEGQQLARFNPEEVRFTLSKAGRGTAPINQKTYLGPKQRLG